MCSTAQPGYWPLAVRDARDAAVERRGGMQGTGGDARDARDGTGCRELEALGGGGGGGGRWDTCLQANQTEPRKLENQNS